MVVEKVWLRERKNSKRKEENVSDENENCKRSKSKQDKSDEKIMVSKDVQVGPGKSRYQRNNLNHVTYKYPTRHLMFNQSIYITFPMDHRYLKKENCHKCGDDMKTINVPREGSSDLV